MTDRVLQHRRTHNLLLLRKHFSLREGSSPFTLVIDTVERSAKALIKRYIHDAKVSKVAVIFVSFETFMPPSDGMAIVNARQMNPSELGREIAQAAASLSAKHSLVIIDTLHPLLTYPHLNTAAFLSSILQPQPVPAEAPPLSSPPAPPSLLAIYHADIPLSPPPSSTAPPPFALLSYLATTILNVHSPAHLYAKHQAAARSLPEPVFGLTEGREGILIGLPPTLPAVDAKTGNGRDNIQSTAYSKGDLVLEVEFRRKSGRAVREWFYVPFAPRGQKADHKDGGDIVLLDDHPLFASLTSPSMSSAPGSGDTAAARDSDTWGATFDLTLTAKQRRDRDEVVLPYFDAQKVGGFGGHAGQEAGTGLDDGRGDKVAAGGTSSGSMRRGELGSGDGGRILYDLGAEDDFDEEEDEI